MYSDYMIKNSRMQMFVKSVLSQLNENEQKTEIKFSSKKSKEIYDFIEKFIDNSNKEAELINKKKPNARLSVPYEKYKYLKASDGEKILENLKMAGNVKKSIDEAFKDYLKNNDMKSLKSRLVSIANSPAFSSIWSSAQGNLQIPAKMALLHYLKKDYNIVIPINYTGYDRDPEVVDLILKAKLNPVYSIHLLSRFIELQVLAELTKKKKLSDEQAKDILSAILTSSDIKKQMIEHIKNNKDGDFDATVKEPIKHLDIEFAPAATTMKHSTDIIAPEHGKMQREEIKKGTIEPIIIDKNKKVKR